MFPASAGLALEVTAHLACPLPQPLLTATLCAVRPVTRLTGVATVTATVHCVVRVWVNESWPRMWSLRRLIVRVEVAA